MNFFNSVFKFWINKKQKEKEYQLKRELLINETSANLKAVSNLLDKLLASTMNNTADIAVVKNDIHYVKKDVKFLKEKTK